MCANTVCATGDVAPYDYLNEGLRNGQAFRNGSFITVHDPSTKTLLTFLSGTYQRAGLGYASIAGALSRTLLGPSNEIGTFNGNIIVPFRPYWLIHSPGDPETTPHPIIIGSSFGGRTIPIGTPVIMSKLCDFMPVTNCE
jgi:hypothetical protein